MPHSFTRRAALLNAAAICTLPALASLAKSILARDENARAPQLGFSLYGMKSLPLADALRHCEEIGYHAVELPVLADWPADSAKFGKAQQQEFRDSLKRSSLGLSALMENLPLLGDASKHQSNLDRLKAAAELSQRLVPEEPPLVETVLGGKVGSWSEVKQQFVDRLGDWCEVMASAKVQLAVKCHISNAMQRPEQLRWVLEQVNHPWLTAAYDYSHFELQQLAMADSLEPLAGRISFVHVKDARGSAGMFQFLLPGDGKTDYSKLFAALKAAKYSGDIIVEVSGQLHSKPDYDPLAAARRSYAALAPAMKQFSAGPP
jgi:inosose dehydratase